MKVYADSDLIPFNLKSVKQLPPRMHLRMTDNYDMGIEGGVSITQNAFNPLLWLLFLLLEQRSQSSLTASNLDCRCGGCVHQSLESQMGQQHR